MNPITTCVAYTWISWLKFVHISGISLTHYLWSPVYTSSHGPMHLYKFNLKHYITPTLLYNRVHKLSVHMRFALKRTWPNGFPLQSLLSSVTFSLCCAVQSPKRQIQLFEDYFNIFLVPVFNSKYQAVCWKYGFANHKISSACLRKRVFYLCLKLDSKKCHCHRWWNDGCWNSSGVWQVAV